MKKSLMILASVALGASMATADTNVESKNIVGFAANTNAVPGFWLVGCSFQNMTNGNSVTIQELIPTNELYASPTLNDKDGSDKILTWNGGAYITFNYINRGNVGDPKWYKSGALANFTDRFSRGQGFWFSRAANSPARTLTVSGQAPMELSYTHANIPVGFLLIANGYPNETAVTNLGFTAYASPVLNDKVNSDKLMTWNGGAYITYNFINRGNAGDPKWYKSGAIASPSFALKPGESAWYSRATGGGIASWTENKPYN